MFEDGAFVRPARERRVTPAVERSAAWFAGQRGHLAPARVQAGLVKAGDS
jgi:hypothetical protein